MQLLIELYNAVIVMHMLLNLTLCLMMMDNKLDFDIFSIINSFMFLLTSMI